MSTRRLLVTISGVDLVRVVNGQILIGQAKTQASNRRPGQKVHDELWPLALVLLMSGLAAYGFIALLLREWFYAPLSFIAAALLVVTRVTVQRRKEADQSLAWFSAFSARGLIALAAQLAGRKRPGLRDEWRAHLAGESGHDLVTWPKVKEALGFVASAIQCRLADAADAAWTSVDAILKSRKLSNLLIFGPTVMAAGFILRHFGTLGVLTSAESISAIGGGLYGLLRVGRWWRDVKPPEPKARRAKEQ